MKRAAIYLRVSTLDQCPQTQVYDLRQMAKQREFTIVEEYVDHGVSGTRISRPALDRLIRDAHRGQFDVVMVWAFDRLARSVSHLIAVLDQLNDLGIEFISYREAVDTQGALGRAITIILGAIAELERSLIVERVQAGLRRARQQGRQLGRRPLPLDRAAIAQDRQRGTSVRQLACQHSTSKSTIQRILATTVPKTPVLPCN